MPQPHHYCSAGWKIGAHLPDDCAGSRDRALLAGREGCGYTMMTALLAGTEKIAARLRKRLEKGARLHDDYTAGRDTRG